MKKEAKFLNYFRMSVDSLEELYQTAMYFLQKEYRNMGKYIPPKQVTLMDFSITNILFRVVIESVSRLKAQIKVSGSAISRLSNSR
jgi:hypothetical protein